MPGGGSGEFSALVFNLVAVWIESRRRRIADQEFGHDEAKVLQRVRKEVREDLRLDCNVAGLWSFRASEEAANLLEPLKEAETSRHLLNIVIDAR